MSKSIILVFKIIYNIYMEDPQPLNEIQLPTESDAYKKVRTIVIISVIGIVIAIIFIFYLIGSAANKTTPQTTTTKKLTQKQQDERYKQARELIDSYSGDPKVLYQAEDILNEILVSNDRNALA